MASLKALAERAFVRSVSNPLLSRPMARAADLRLPRPVLRGLISGYTRLYGVDLSEIAEPVESFATFNAFFTRRLRAGARPVAAGADVVVSPADSRLHSIGAVPEGGRLEQIKGRTYALEALLGDAQDAAAFAGGVHATLYLSPAMYHRVHSPVDGRIVGWRYLPGRLFPVNAMAVRHVEGLFAVNERVCVRLETEAFGAVAVVFVGAANVGRIGLSFAPDVATNASGPAFATRPPAPIPIGRGDELGAFNLGSTVVLLAADGRLQPAAEPGRILRMGEPLWRRGV